MVNKWRLDLNPTCERVPYLGQTVLHTHPLSKLDMTVIVMELTNLLELFPWAILKDTYFSQVSRISLGVVSEGKFSGIITWWKPWIFFNIHALSTRGNTHVGFQESSFYSVFIGKIYIRKKLYEISFCCFKCAKSNKCVQDSVILHCCRL